MTEPQLLIALDKDVSEEAQFMANMLDVPLGTFVNRAVRHHIAERLRLPETAVRVREHAEGVQSVSARLLTQARAARL